ncbi:MAG: DNA primase [Candidatus Dormiibacterota bacterium]
MKDRLDIVEVISGYVRLQRAGRDHKGLCPFHAEKSPSFGVSGEKQVWYCFGCSQGGDLFDFVQKIEGTDFPQTLEMLAARAGVELEDRSGSRRRGQERARSREVNALAAQYFHHILLNHRAGSRGLTYLQKRGVEPETIEAFAVGYAPMSRNADNLLRFLKSKGVGDDEAVKAGLALGGEGRRTIDRFRGRLMIPIRDETGTIVAFGGRAMDSTPPKYMNSPQTSIYDKGRTIFGLSQAKKAISAGDKALLVEGYFDVMMAHQNGIASAIASSGTAFTPEQVKIVRRFAADLLVCLDADEAGRNATQRVIEMASKAHMRVTVVELPNAKDPGEFFQKTPQLWGDAEGAALAGWEWWIGAVLAEHRLTTPDGRAAAASALVGVLARIPEDTTLDVYCQYTAEKLGVDAAHLLADVQTFRRTGARPRLPEPAPTVDLRPAGPVAPPTNGNGRALLPEEDELLALVLAAPEAGAVFTELTSAADDHPEELSQLGLVRRVIDVVSGEGGGTLERHLERFSEDERPRLARISMTARFNGGQAELRSAINDFVLRIRLKSCEAAMAEVEEHIAGTGSESASTERDGLLAQHRVLALRRAGLKTRLYQGRP